MTNPTNPHLFPLILVEYGQPGATSVGQRPAEQQRVEVTDAERAVIRFDHGALHVWITEKGDRDDERGYLAQVHLAFASIVEFSDTEVTFAGVEVVDMRATGRPARVIFTNQHSGWQ